MNKSKRKLTPAEMKRKEVFEKTSKEMERNGYKKKDITVGILKANILSIAIMLPFSILISYIYYAINPIKSIVFQNNINIWFIIFLIISVVVHEGIHGLVWGKFAKNHLKSIEFGIIWKALTPYCTCLEPLKKWQYIIGALMPTIILGFGLSIIAIIGNIFWLFLIAIIMIFGGGGDFLIVLKLLLYNSKNKEVLYYDHPYECGLVAFEKNI